MTQDQLTLLLIKGTIADLPDADRQKVDEATRQVRELLAIYPEGHAALALALLGAELAAKAQA
ncbi:hypothetical protein [Crenobacter luteus]|uniref:Uncharacterized protein n=1 Tax=Crenobacter luteus TaxID=1452487 RepID=A0A165FUB0_9NEIS|nr:hypothetical protein [Crenobacter luteus]KZE34224.1 hypothetical protein AVW16_06755 [Crenobacter luteus]